jgi:hypothetical protein
LGVAVAAAGSWASKPLAERVEFQSPDTPPFPDGSTITVTITGTVPSSCRGYPLDVGTDCVPREGCRTAEFRVHDAYTMAGFFTPMDRHEKPAPDESVHLDLFAIAAC